MKCVLSTSERIYSEEENRKELEELGFSFLERDGSFYIKGSPEIEINSIGELLEFINKHGKVIIFPKEPSNNWKMEIYNWYRE